MTSWKEGRTALLCLFATAAISCTAIRGTDALPEHAAAGAGGVHGRAAGTDGGMAGSHASGQAGTPAAGSVAASDAMRPFSCAAGDHCSTFEQPAALDADGHSYWDPFWCPPGDCLGRVQPELETTGSENHVFLSSLTEPAGPEHPAWQLGTGLNSDALGRHPFSQVAIEFDYWPLAPVDPAPISWFSISNGERQFLQFVTTGSRTYVDYNWHGEWNAVLQSPPLATKVHVRIEITRTDAQNCMLAVRYGDEDEPTVFPHALIMPAKQAMEEAQPYDAYIGLWVPDDSMTHMVSARYDNFLTTWTAWDGS